MDNNQRKEEIKENVCSYLKQGMFKKDASKMAGISEDTYLRWYREDADFADRVEASILEYKQSLIQNLNIQAEKNGMLALKILQIRFPQEWGEPKVLQSEEKEEASIKEIANLLQKVYQEGNDANEISSAGLITERVENKLKGQEFFS